jgi:hypothetical protein
MGWRTRRSYQRFGQRLLFLLFALAVVGGLFVEALRSAAPVPAPIYHRRSSRGRRATPSEVNCTRLASGTCANGS